MINNLLSTQPIPESQLIKEKRLALNMTQKELADAIGLSKYGDRTIRRWENGDSKPSPLELLSVLEFPESPPFLNNELAEYTSVDLFAGIGGIRLGFQQTGRVRNIFSSEWDKFSQKTYRANFGEIPYGDITKINEKDIPDHDILLAGFPCQAFSQAGKKLGFEDTRGTLFFDIARIIKEKKPKAFLLENVKNLKTHDRGRTYRTIVNTLEEMNYKVYTMLYKARDFGVPQNRERIYIVGFEKNKVSKFNNFMPPKPTGLRKNLGSILENNVDSKYTISDKLWEGHKRRKDMHKEKGNGFGYSIYNEKSLYTNTLSARYYKDGSEILIEQSNNNPRKITPREAARLQGFPENFIIPVSDTQAYKQFGNSVCVATINAISLNILKILDEN
ncbi:DNA (cytosine-5-)-methyltransferase [Macrococcoides canis]|uniref:DNA (cytosine-5-)-methyltransferase n=1 Tax=Macrococcoides canis TaxID=1855823 RepID=UPI0020B6E544|nr:DNA (cytosine-5-)-methyltransferase [Macrococcus canis]UTG99519.1 DNA (cytosine-5-)-methyltransferase [Macrococcus canis]